MSARPQQQVIDSYTEPDRSKLNMIELMRAATDGSNSFLSRRAQQILLAKHRIVVIV